jgi:hypothetical protein
MRSLPACCWQMDKAEKNKISHRYRSLSLLKDYLVAHGSELQMPAKAAKTE